jgi:large subunit ribosomal protein L4
LPTKSKSNSITRPKPTKRPEQKAKCRKWRLLEVQSLRIQKEAAILAAQVHEHYAEAQRLAGDEEAADDVLGLASEERVKVDEVNELLLEKRLAHAKLEVRVKGTLGDRAGQKKAQAAVERVKAKIEEMEAARLAADEEGLDEPVLVEKK